MVIHEEEDCQPTQLLSNTYKFNPRVTATCVEICGADPLLPCPDHPLVSVHIPCVRLHAVQRQPFELVPTFEIRISDFHRPGVAVRRAGTLALRGLLLLLSAEEVFDSFGDGFSEAVLGLAGGGFAGGGMVRRGYIRVSVVVDVLEFESMKCRLRRTRTAKPWLTDVHCLLYVYGVLR